MLWTACAGGLPPPYSETIILKNMPIWFTPKMRGSNTPRSGPTGKEKPSRRNRNA